MTGTLAAAGSSKARPDKKKAVPPVLFFERPVGTRGQRRRGCSSCRHNEATPTSPTGTQAHSLQMARSGMDTRAGVARTGCRTRAVGECVVGWRSRRIERNGKKRLWRARCQEVVVVVVASGAGLSVAVVVVVVCGTRPVRSD